MHFPIVSLNFGNTIDILIKFKTAQFRFRIDDWRVLYSNVVVYKHLFAYRWFDTCVYNLQLFCLHSTGSHDCIITIVMSGMMVNVKWEQRPSESFCAWTKIVIFQKLESLKGKKFDSHILYTRIQTRGNFQSICNR